MDRRKFLVGASAGVGVATLGVVGKLAPTPIVEGTSEVVVEREIDLLTLHTSLPQGTWRMLNQGVPFFNDKGDVVPGDDGLPLMTLEDWNSIMLRHDSDGLL